MKRLQPKTYEYFKRFEGDPVRAPRGTLRGRALYRQYFKPTDPFYSMYNVGSYTLSPWKVLWPEVGNSVRAGVCGPQTVDTEKPVLPDHTVVAVSCESKQEAHYICALLNSAPAQLAISGYIVLHPSPHVLENISIPQFNATDEIHIRLAQLSEQAHEAAGARRTEVVQRIEADVDRAAAELWGIATDELGAIHAALEEQRRGWKPEADNLSLELDENDE
jgi:hypothetical protein